MRYLVPISTGNWARYVDKIRSQVRTRVNQYRLLRVLPNRLTPVYSKHYYEEENYLKVKTVVFKYITPPHSNSWFVLTFLHILYTEFNTLGTRVHLIYSPWFVMWLGYPLSYSSTSSISPASCVLTANLSKSSLSTCTIQYIRSVTTFSILLLMLWACLLYNTFIKLLYNNP